jgi:hypothetical protein
MKTENMCVTFLGKTDNQHTKGKSYAVKSCINTRDGHEFPIELLIETDLSNDFKRIWMPATMKSGDKSISTLYELVVLPGYTIGATMQMDANIAKPVLDKQLKESVEKIIADSLFKPVAITGAGFEIGCCEQTENGLIKQQNEDGTVSYFLDPVHRSPLSERGDQLTSDEVLMELRNVLRCPDGANIVIWAEILAAGYFGEKHRKGGAIEDAIHYKKMGAYSDEALGKILAAIVNDGTKS